MTYGFAAFHPALNFAYFALSMGLILWLTHPLYLVTALAGMLIFNLMMGGGTTLKKRVPGYGVLLMVVTAFNPLFSSRGATILLYFRNRPVTLESLFYGFFFGLTLITLLITFQTYEKVVTADKFLYLTSAWMPRTGLVISMTTRFLPLMKRRLAEISDVARTRETRSKLSYLDKGKTAVETLNVLITWTLEESLQTAAAMRSRGYGIGKRSAVMPFHWEKKDGLLLFLMVPMILLLTLGTFRGYGLVIFYPRMTGLTLRWEHYLLFLWWSLGPILINSGEMLKWKIINLKK